MNVGTGRRAVAQSSPMLPIAPGKRVKTRQHENFRNRINGTTAASWIDGSWNWGRREISLDKRTLKKKSTVEANPMFIVIFLLLQCVCYVYTYGCNGRWNLDTRHCICASDLKRCINFFIPIIPCDITFLISIYSMMLFNMCI